MTDLVPAALLEKVRQGEVVLFLGAGAARGAQNKSGHSLPDGPGLAKLLADKFLGGEDATRPLAIVSELAISETDLLTVQQFVRDIFIEFQPTPFHKLLPTFRWAAIVSTNYDLISEESYNGTKLQALVPFYRNSDRVDQRMRSANSLPLLKIHGCISKYSEIDVPMILTVDQYVTHKKGRDRLFNRFKDYASEYTVVFVGHSLEDQDIRQAISEVSTDDISRPRFYVVSPNPSPRQIRFWETKKISAIPCTFEAFLHELDHRLDKSLRTVATTPTSHPIQRRFIKHAALIPDELVALLQENVTYIRNDLPSASTNPRDFYRGYARGWSFIQQQLDARRHLSDTVLSDVVLADEADRPTRADVYLLKGYAGSGITTLLKRIAWDAATQFGKLCLYLNPGRRISIAPLITLAELSGERLFLFVDDPVDVLGDLASVFRLARARNLLLTVILGERANEWNNECSSLDSYVNDVFEVRYLSVTEIGWLLDKLAEHHSLGVLEGQSRQEQVRRFVETADKQLIVALHEATSGRPFREIVVDEYQHISPPDAQQIYLSICALNRLDVPVRAGIIRRLHGVSFESFRERFFKPLESIVYTEQYEPGKDMAYRTRHPWIAEVVFERALPSEQDRLNLYIRLLDCLDIGYEPDRKAYRGLIRARDLLLLFSDPLLVRRLYESAKALGNDDAYYHQQQAIYEMRRQNPNFSLAYDYLQISRRLAPSDKSVIHTLADLELRRASGAQSTLERDKYLRSAQDLSGSILGKDADTSHGYYTACEVALSESVRNFVCEAYHVV